MEVELKLEPGRRDPKVVILANERTPELEALVRQLSGLSIGPLTVWRDGRAELVKVPPERRPSKESLDRLNRDVEGLVRMTGNQVAK